jgi:hypothetical protein
MTSRGVKIGVAVFFILIGAADLVYGIVTRDTFSIIVGPVIILFAANTLRRKNSV